MSVYWGPTGADPANPDDWTYLGEVATDAYPGGLAECGIPGHPPTGHGGHPGCPTHGDLRYHDGWWSCPGWDGEGCATYPTKVPDQYAYATTEDYIAAHQRALASGPHVQDGPHGE